MYLVVDPNVVISALIKKGSVSEVFSLNFIFEKFKFIAPNFLIQEVGKHTIKIMNKTHLSKEMIDETLGIVTEQITFIAEEEFSHKNEEAQKILKEHEKDVPYLALALAFGCKIFSGDKVLKSIIQDKVLTPKELLEKF